MGIQVVILLRFDILLGDKILAAVLLRLHTLKRDLLPLSMSLLEIRFSYQKFLLQEVT